MPQAEERAPTAPTARGSTADEASDAPPATVPAPPAAARLVVPEGLLIDDIVRDRLERQLRRASLDVDGIVAELDEPPPGSSCRVHAEWRSLAAPSSLAPTTTVRGAVLLREGVAFEAADRSVEVRGASLLVDAGTVVHDPHRPVGALRVASEQGRPPFPHRPVVVFLAVDPDVRLAEWARRLANGLLRRDVEARLALPAPSEGLNLTRPCLPREASLRALAPDAIVALDAGACACAPHWCGNDRSTVIIELAEDLADPVELVPWQISRAEGRLRARIDRRVDPPTLARLVLRLCAGPHPVPPAIVEPVAGEQTVARDVPLVRIRPATVVLTGPLDAAATARVEGLTDHLAAEGFKVAVVPFEDGIPNGTRSLPLVVLAGVAGMSGIDELLAIRTAARLPTVLDVCNADLLHDESGRVVAPTLTPEAARLVVACGSVTTPAGAARHAVRDLRVRTLTLPTLLTRTHAAELWRALAAHEDSGELVIGWRLDLGGSVGPPYTDTAAQGVAQLLAEGVDMRVHVVTEARSLPAPLRSNDRVLVDANPPGPDALVTWTVQLLTPTIVAEEVVGDLREFVEATCAGVPSVLPAAARRAIDGHPSPQLVVRDVKDPKAWRAALRNVLGDAHRRARRVEETVRHGLAVNGAAASRSVVDRFIGWALYEGDR